MRKSKFYLYLGLSLLAFSCIWIFLTFYTIKANGVSVNSPRTVPFFLGICMSILSVVFLYQYRLGFRPKNSIVGLQKNEIKNFFSIMLILILYNLFLEWFGFFLSTLLFMYLLSRFLLQEKNWLVNYLLPIILTSTIYFVFVILLHSSLPRGTIIRLF